MTILSSMDSPFPGKYRQKPSQSTVQLTPRPDHSKVTSTVNPTTTTSSSSASQKLTQERLAVEETLEALMELYERITHHRTQLTAVDQLEASVKQDLKDSRDYLLGIKVLMETWNRDMIQQQGQGMVKGALSSSPVVGSQPAQDVHPSPTSSPTQSRPDKLPSKESNNNNKVLVKSHSLPETSPVTLKSKSRVTTSFKKSSPLLRSLSNTSINTTNTTINTTNNTSQPFTFKKSKKHVSQEDHMSHEEVAGLTVHRGVKPLSLLQDRPRRQASMNMVLTEPSLKVKMRRNQ